VVPDPDDWFAEPSERPFRQSRRAAPTPADDRWLDEPPVELPSSEPRALHRSPWAWVVLAAVAVALVVGGLFAAGVFNGSSSPAQSPPTQRQTTTRQQTTTQTTTQSNKPTAALPAPTETLKPGDNGAQVKKLQRALKSLGYTVGAIDGDYGTKTEDAVKQFQQKEKLTVDGVLGPKTLAALKQSLRAGTSG
jgi:hypothetical protein